MSQFELTEVSQDAARGDVKIVYDAIRSDMGVAVVNLIWRRLATQPEALRFAWQRLQPIYAHGAVPAAAMALRHSIAVPHIKSLSVEDVAQRGIDPTELLLIDAVMRTYERGNAQNLIALAVLRQDMDPQWRAAQRARPPGNPVDTPDEDADRLTEELPPLPAMAALDPAASREIEDISKVWVPDPQRGMIPSVFRHLGYWPALLKYFRGQFQAIDPSTTAGIPTLAEAAIDEAARRAGQLHRGLGEAGTPSESDRAFILETVRLFIDAMIGRGVVVVPAMRRALPLTREPS